MTRSTNVPPGAHAAQGEARELQAEVARLRDLLEEAGIYVESREPILDRIATALASASQWAIVELLGHQTWAGRISEVERLGHQFLRIEVPSRDVVAVDQYNGRVPAHTVPGFIVDFGVSSIRSIEECDETVARERWRVDWRYRAGWTPPEAVPYPPPAAGMLVVMGIARETITGVAPAEPGGRPERIETDGGTWWRRAEWPHLDHVDAIYDTAGSLVWGSEEPSDEIPF